MDALSRVKFAGWLVAGGTANYGNIDAAFSLLVTTMPNLPIPIRTLSLILAAACALAACGSEQPPAPATKAPPAPAAAQPAPVAVPPAAPVEPTLEVVRWGPDVTPVGVPFNVQPNGMSALWFEMKGNVDPATMEARLGEHKLELTIIPNKGGGMLIPAELLAKPGRQPLALIFVPTKKRFELGNFEVTPGPQTVPAITVTAWGPESTPAGQTFNVQPGGTSAIWFKMDGAVYPGTMQGWLGDKQIDLAITSHHGGALLVPSKLISKAGQRAVYLLHVPSKTKFELGSFEVTAAAGKKADAPGGGKKTEAQAKKAG